MSASAPILLDGGNPWALEAHFDANKFVDGARPSAVDVALLDAVTHVPPDAEGDTFTRVNAWKKKVERYNESERAKFDTNAEAYRVQYPKRPEADDDGDHNDDDAAAAGASPNARGNVAAAGTLSPPADGQWARRRVGLMYDPRFLLHKTREDHPEQPARAARIFGGLVESGLVGQCFPVSARRATEEEMARAHDLVHVRAVMEGSVEYPDDSYFHRRHSADAVALASGGCINMATAVLEGKLQTGFCIVRPPGHHAEVSAAMGFCFINHVAVAARAVIAQGLAQRVAVFDWDVHHGNGSEDIFAEDPNVLYVSTHRMDEQGFFYPGTGHVDVAGQGKGVGKNLNIPMPSPSGDDEYMLAFEKLVLPVLDEFAPDLLIVSAGFDAAEGDPLGGMLVSPNGFAHMTTRLCETFVNKTMFVLEGGYNLDSITNASVACVRAMLGKPAAQPERWHARMSLHSNSPVRDRMHRNIANVESVHKAHWKRLSLEPEAAAEEPASPTTPVAADATPSKEGQGEVGEPASVVQEESGASQDVGDVLAQELDSLAIKE